MSKLSVSLFLSLLAAMTTVGAQQGAPARPAAGPMASVAERTAGLRKMDGYFPLYWDERAGTMLLEIPRLDTEFLLSTGLSAGLGSNDIGLDRGQGGGGTHRHVPARRPARHARAGRTSRSGRAARTRSSASRSKTRSPSRSSGASRSPPNRTAACWSMPPTSSCATSTGAASAPAAGQLPRRSHAQRVLPAEHPQLPEEHRSRHDADLRQRGGRRRRRRRRRSGAGSGADRPDAGGGGGGGFGGGLFSGSVGSVTPIARSGDAARACVVRGAARRQLHSRASTIRAPATAA